MPSSAPTVRRGSGRAGLGRPEASEVEGARAWYAVCGRPTVAAREAPARRRPSPGLGMVYLLAPTDMGGRAGRVGGAEPGTVSLRGSPSSRRLPVSLGGQGGGVAAPETGRPGPELLSLPASAGHPLTPDHGALCASAPRPRPPSGSAGEEETWLPPGDNARENLGSTSRRAGRLGRPTSGPSCGRLRAPESSAALCRLRVHFPFRPLFSASGTLTPLTRSLF